jgi:hypothetical protein
MTWALLKAPEHTWGTSGIKGGGSYNVSLFRSLLDTPAYLNAAASWAEQRFFNEIAVRSLEEADHPLAVAARAEMDMIVNVAAPDTTGYTPVASTESVTFAGTAATITLASDGSIVGLHDKGIAWASPTSPLALFTYQTFNDTEWLPFTYNYINDHSESGSFCKKGSNNWTESKVWTPTLEQVSGIATTSAPA